MRVLGFKVNCPRTSHPNPATRDFFRDDNMEQYEEYRRRHQPAWVEGSALGQGRHAAATMLKEAGGRERDTIVVGGGVELRYSHTRQEGTSATVGLVLAMFEVRVLGRVQNLDVNVRCQPRPHADTAYAKPISKCATSNHRRVTSGWRWRCSAAGGLTRCLEARSPTRTLAWTRSTCCFRRTTAVTTSAM